MFGISVGRGVDVGEFVAVAGMSVGVVDVPQAGKSTITTELKNANHFDMLFLSVNSLHNSALQAINVLAFHEKG
jgi:hypothetical protein